MTKNKLSCVGCSTPISCELLVVFLWLIGALTCIYNQFLIYACVSSSHQECASIK